MSTSRTLSTFLTELKDASTLYDQISCLMAMYPNLDFGSLQGMPESDHIEEEIFAHLLHEEKPVQITKTSFSISGVAKPPTKREGSSSSQQQQESVSHQNDEATSVWDAFGCIVAELSKRRDSYAHVVNQNESVENLERFHLMTALCTCVERFFWVATSPQNAVEISSVLLRLLSAPIRNILNKCQNLEQQLRIISQQFPELELHELVNKHREVLRTAERVDLDPHVETAKDALRVFLYHLVMQKDQAERDGTRDALLECVQRFIHVLEGQQAEWDDEEEDSTLVY